MYVKLIKTAVPVICLFFSLYSSILLNFNDSHLLENFLSPNDLGKNLFVKHCSSCHGIKGNKGKFGAKNLQNSILTDEQYFDTILNGKGIMPSWENKLSLKQLLDIVNYIKTLKNE
jgi:cytochrome c553